MAKGKEQTWWAIKNPDGSFQVDIGGHPWVFTSRSKRDHRKMVGGGSLWVRVKLVEVKKP